MAAVAKYRDRSPVPDRPQARWKSQAEEYRSADRIEVKASREYASSIMNAAGTGEPSVIYGNVRNDGLIRSLPDGCAVEVPCLVDRNGIQPTFVGDLPPQLTALIRTNINVPGTDGEGAAHREPRVHFITPR